LPKNPRLGAYHSASTSHSIQAVVKRYDETHQANVKKEITERDWRLNADQSF